LLKCGYLKHLFYVESRLRVCVQLPLKRLVQQRLEEVLRLALGFALLGAQPLESVDDAGELLLEWERGLD
jgi:hypothetical protein